MSGLTNVTCTVAAKDFISAWMRQHGNRQYYVVDAALACWAANGCPMPTKAKYEFTPKGCLPAKICRDDVIEKYPGQVVPEPTPPPAPDDLFED